MSKNRSVYALKTQNPEKIFSPKKLLSRRSALKLMTASLGGLLVGCDSLFTEPYTPDPRPRKIAVTSGCYSASYAGAGSGSIGCGLISSFGNTVLDREFVEEVQIQSNFWSLFPKVYGFDECAGQINALALPEGVILLGIRLTQNVIRNYGNSLPLAGVLAHEWGHQAQFRFNWMDSSQPTARNTELEADAFSGYYMGLGKGWAGSKLEDFLGLLESLGDTNFTDRNHHGTPQERRTAGTLGLQTAYEAINRGVRFDYATLHATFTRTLSNLKLIEAHLLPSKFVEAAEVIEQNLDTDFLRNVLGGLASPAELPTPTASFEQRRQLFPKAIFQ